MRSITTFKLLLAILVCTFSVFSFSTVKAQGIYWYEGFNNSTGKINSSSTDPSVVAGTVTVTYQQGDAGVWALYGAYRTTGSGCAAYGLGHIRMLKYTDGTTPWIVSPIVNKGISEIHFTPTTAGKRWIVMWTADTAATTTNWTKILDSVSIKTSCVDTVLLVNLPSAQRIKFKDVTNPAAGYQLDVDSIYFKSVNPLPVRFAGINANLLSNKVKVNWVSELEIGTLNYSIEKSTTGSDFKEIGKIFASNNTNYSWIDQTPANGVNYYRVKSTDNNGTVYYSSVVKVLRQTKTGVTVFPNPVINKTLNLQIDGMTEGQYTVNIYNINGQKVSSTPINMTNSSLSQTLTLPNSTKAGIYQLELTNGVNRTIQTIEVR